MAEQLLLGMADLDVRPSQRIILRTYPLGACLGIAIFDPVARVGGLLHSMLPDSSIDPKRAAERPGMFLDTGIAELLQRAERLNAKPANILLYVAGGARIMDESGYFNIGGRNHDVLASLLKKHGLTIQAEEVGGLANCSMQLNAATGEVRLKISGQPKLKLLCKPSTTT